MTTENQEVQKLAVPAFLRKGLEAFRLGNGTEQSYIIRSRWKDQTYRFEPWQFFILEVLPGCEDFTRLASVFEDRFGHCVTEEQVKELFSLVVDRELFGDDAISHPMLASYKEINTTMVVGKLSQEELLDKGKVNNTNHAAAKASGESQGTLKVKKNMEPDRKTASNGAVGENGKSLPSAGLPYIGFDDPIIYDGDEEPQHLQRAMRKVQTSASGQHMSKTIPLPSATPPGATNQEQSGSHIHQAGRVSPKLQLQPSVAERAEPNVAAENKPAIDAVEEPLPAGVLDAVGLDSTMRIKSLKLFNPTWLIKLLHPMLSPFKHTIYLLPLLLIAALFISVRYAMILEEDFSRFLAATSFVEHVLLGMVTVNLSVTLATALVAYTYRATIDGFCVAFFLLFLPRFMVRISHVEQLTRRERIWLHAAPLLMRLALFSIGILVWFEMRSTHDVLAYKGMWVALIAAISFLITVSPFLKSSGYHLMAAFLDEPHLRGKSYKALLNKFRGNVYRKSDSNTLVVFALASALYTVAVIAALLYIFGRFLDIEFGGISLAVILFISLVLIWRMIIEFNEAEKAYESSVQFERWRNRTLPQIEEDPIEKTPPKTTVTYLSRSLLLLLVAALFLPYTYEPGGSFIVLPNQQQNISPEIGGIIDNINYDGGEMLKKNTVIGQLSYSDYAAQVKIYDAKIKQQQAVISELKARPRPEELKLAKSTLETKKTQAEFSKAKAARYEKLFKEGVISFEDLDDARREYNVDLDQVQEQTAHLELVKSGATPNEIAEAEAKLQSYQEERDHYQEKIKQSILYMPFDGKLITLHLKQKIGSYLDKGEPLAVAEETDKVKAEIEIPETDISYLKEKSQIRFRFRVYSDESFLGVVKTIDASVQDDNHNKVVKVVALLENKDARLKSGMTGYAKINGEKMPIWKVLSLAIIRFIKVEVWSWLP